MNGNLATGKLFSGIIKQLYYYFCNGSWYGNWQFNSAAEKHCFPQKNAQF